MMLTSALKPAVDANIQIRSLAAVMLDAGRQLLAQSVECDQRYRGSGGATSFQQAY